MMTTRLEDLISFEDLTEIVNENRPELIARLIEKQIKPDKIDDNNYYFTLKNSFQIKHMLLGNYPLTMSDVMFLTNAIHQNCSFDDLKKELTNLLIHTSQHSDYKYGSFTDDYFTKTYLNILKEHVGNINESTLDYFSNHAFHMIQSEAGVVYKSLDNKEYIQCFETIMMRFKSIPLADKPFDQLIQLISDCIYVLPNENCYKYIKHTINNILSMFRKLIIDDYITDNFDLFNKDIKYLIVDLLSVHLPIQSHLKASTYQHFDFKTLSLGSLDFNKQLTDYLNQECFKNVLYTEVNEYIIEPKITNLIDEDIHEYVLTMYMHDHDYSDLKVFYSMSYIPDKLAYEIKNMQSNSNYNDYFEKLKPHLD